MPDLKIAIFCEKQVKIQTIQNFAMKVLNIRISRFFVIQRENGNYNMFCKFQHHSMQIFFSKWRINVFLKLKRLQQPPSPSNFDGLPYPRVRRYPHFFFMKMTAKDVKEITYMPLVTFFSVLE